VCLWTGLSGLTLVERALHDRRWAPVRDALARLRDPALHTLPAAERARRVDALLAPLGARTLDRVAADSAVPGWAAETVAAHLVRRGAVERLARSASAHRGAAAKWRRVAALRILVRARHGRALELLERALADPDREVVGAAVGLLGMLDERRAARLLLGALTGGTYAPSRVATALDHFPVPILDLIRPLLRHPAPVARFWGATLLARYRETPGLDAELAPLVRDPDPGVRKAAVETLGLVGGPEAAPSARALLGDPVWYVRAHAARALGDLRRRDLAAAVTPLLADREWWVRLAAKETLEAMGPAVWPDVVPYLSHADRFARNGAAEVLQNLGLLDTWIVEAARGLAPPERLQVLRQAAGAGEAGLLGALRERVEPGFRQAVDQLVAELGFQRAGEG